MTEHESTLVDSLYAASLPPQTPLFHYTSLSGLIGILDKGELWASELRSLNDATELVRGFDLLAVEGKRRLNGVDGEIAKQFIDWIQHRSRFGPMLFGSAFTEQGNLLSQWRGYCPPGAGVSFGVAFSEIKKSAASHSFRLGRCIYDPEHQHDLAGRLVDYLFEFARSAGPDRRLAPEQSFHSRFLEREDQVLHWCALMKHPAFEAEAEWRAVSAAYHDFVRGSGASIRYRAGQSMLVPYIGLPLTNASNIIPIDVVITGPTPHPERASASIQTLVAKHLKGLHGPWLSRYCDLPFRAW